MATLGFVGLGVMGLPMAGHLIRAGHDVVVWNRTPGKADSLVEAGGRLADDLAELGAQCDIVFLCVNRSEDVREVLDGLTVQARPGTLFVDHSTIAPPEAQRLASELITKGFRFVDAPITGGSMGAQKGQLTIFLGGDVSDVEEAMTYINAYARRAERMGPSGAGQMTKMANQIAVGGALLALCECFSFAEKAGLDQRQVRDMVGSGAAASWAFENYSPKILDQDWSPGFSIKNQRKDFGYCKEAAEAIGAAIPGTRLCDDLLRPLQDEGHGEWTTAALYLQLLRMGALD